VPDALEDRNTLAVEDSLETRVMVEAAQLAREAPGLRAIALSGLIRVYSIDEDPARILHESEERDLSARREV